MLIGPYGYCAHEERAARTRRSNAHASLRWFCGTDRRKYRVTVKSVTTGLLRRSMSIASFVSMFAILLLLLKLAPVAVLVAVPMVLDDGHVPEPIAREYGAAIVALVPAGQLTHCASPG